MQVNFLNDLVICGWHWPIYCPCCLLGSWRVRVTVSEIYVGIRAGLLLYIRWRRLSYWISLFEEMLGLNVITPLTHFWPTEGMKHLETLVKAKLNLGKTCVQLLTHVQFFSILSMISSSIFWCTCPLFIRDCHISCGLFCGLIFSVLRRFPGRHSRLGAGHITQVF